VETNEDDDELGDDDKVHPLRPIVSFCFRYPPSPTAVHTAIVTSRRPIHPGASSPISRRCQ
jgi:hypothetical protein